MRRTPGVAFVGLLGLVAWVVVALSVWLALRPDAIGPAAATNADVLLLVAGAGSAITAGLFSAATPLERPFGLLLVTAAIAWLVAGWADPASGSAVMFTLGLVGRAVDGPLVAHATITGMTPSRTVPERVVLGFGYAVSLIGLGLVPATLFVPAQQGCLGCPDNLVAVASAPEVARGVVTVAAFAMAAWAVATIVLLLGLGFAFEQATKARRRPVTTPLLPGESITIK